MKKFTVFEWHEWQPLLLVILGVALVNIFGDNTEQSCFWISFWISLSVLCLIPFVYIFFRRLFKKIRNDNGRADSQEFIDTFDNEIVHNIYNLESHRAKLAEALSEEIHAKTISKEMICFYYIQTSSSFQKTISNLSLLDNISKKVLSCDEKNIIIDGYIPLPVYRNINSLLITIYEYLEAHKDVIEELDDGKFIIELNQIAKSNLDIIESAVSKKFRKTTLSALKGKGEEE
jgi:ABC-type multidrug transport system fused ATPase/permease subunit